MGLLFYALEDLSFIDFLIRHGKKEVTYSDSVRFTLVRLFIVSLNRNYTNCISLDSTKGNITKSTHQHILARRELVGTS